MAAIAKTPAVLSSELLVKSAGYYGWFILLEGDFDQRFWAARLNPSNLKLINCVGKPNVLGTLDLLISTKQAQKIVALADKDYDEILARCRRYSQLFYTDKNDLEVTLLLCLVSRIEPAINRILGESVDASKVTLFEAGIGVSVVEHIRQIAANYGVLRLINQQLESGVSFDGLPILHNDFLNHTTLMQSQATLESAFIDAVNQAGKVELTAAELLVKVESHRINGLFSGWSLVQGHDLIQLLATVINSHSLRLNTGHRQVSEESLARDLCLMIHHNDLGATAMFQGLHRKGNSAGVQFFK
jgi:hypothetical protein